MGLSIVSKIVAGLLAIALTATAITVVLNQTIFSSPYIQGKLQSTNSYSRLSTAITDQVVADSGLGTSPELTARLQEVLSRDTIKSKLNTTLTQLESYYKGKSTTVPTLDLTDIASEIQAQGVPLSTDSTALTEPIKLGVSDGKNPGKSVGTVNQIAIGMCVFFALALLVVSWLRHKYIAFAGVLISSGVSLGILALFLRFSPGLVDKFARFDFGSNAYASITHDLVTSVALDLSSRLGIVAAVLLVIGIVLRIVLGILHHQNPENVQTTTSVAR